MMDDDEDVLPLGIEAPIPDAELHALMLQARRNKDAALHRLVIGYMTLRRVTADMVELIAVREGGNTIVNTPLFKRARELTAPPPR